MPSRNNLTFANIYNAINLDLIQFMYLQKQIPFNNFINDVYANRFVYFRGQLSPTRSKSGSAAITNKFYLYLIEIKMKISKNLYFRTLTLRPCCALYYYSVLFLIRTSIDSAYAETTFCSNLNKAYSRKRS